MAPWRNHPVSPQYVSPSAPSSSTAFVFSPDQRRGVIAMSVASCISCAFVLLLLLCIAVSAILSWREHKVDSPTPFIRRQIAVFVVCLLVADLVQSLSGVLQVKWASENQVYEGMACSTQAIAMTVGNLSSTVWSCVISVHTFSSIALGKSWSRRTIVAIVFLGWSMVLALTIIGPTAFQNSRNGPFFGIAGYWCFITSNYAIHRLVIHYVPLFAATVLIPVFYGLVFFVLRGRISLRPHRIGVSFVDDPCLRERITIAKRMLLYPAAYLTCITPIAIVRLFGLKYEHIPDDVWGTAVFILFLLGAVDSVIYATTRKLVNPTTLNVHIHRWSSDMTVRSDRVRAPHLHSCKSDLNHTHRTDIIDLNSYPASHEDDTQPANARSQLDREIKPEVPAIHITLERTEVVR